MSKRQPKQRSSRKPSTRVESPAAKKQDAAGTKPKLMPFIEMTTEDQGQAFVIGLGAEPAEHRVDTVGRNVHGDLLLLGVDGFAASRINGVWNPGIHFATSETILMLDLPEHEAIAVSKVARALLGA